MTQIPIIYYLVAIIARNDQNTYDFMASYNQGVGPGDQKTSVNHRVLERYTEQ